MLASDIGAISDLLAEMYEELDPEYPHIDPNEIERLTFHILTQLKNPLAIFLIALDGKKHIGFFMGTICQHPYGKPELVGMAQEIYVVPDKRGFEVGTLLIREALKRSLALGAQGFEAVATPGSKGTEKRWTTLGFRPYLIYMHMGLDDAKSIFMKAKKE